MYNKYNIYIVTNVKNAHEKNLIKNNIFILNQNNLKQKEINYK